MENGKTFNNWFEPSQSQRQEKKSALRVMSLASAIADFMVWLTIISDKRKNRQSTRKAMVISRWLQLSGDSLKVPFPGVALL